MTDVRQTQIKMDIVKELFGTEDLYSILAIAKDKVSDEKARKLFILFIFFVL